MSGNALALRPGGALVPGGNWVRFSSFGDVKFVDLKERIGWEASHAAAPNMVSLSITNPTIYREVLDPKPEIIPGGPDGVRVQERRRHDCVVRVTTSFNLTATIRNFNRPNQKNNRFFDSISLKYLFHEGERHEFKPDGDEMVEADVTEGRTKSREAVASLSATGGQATPGVEYHIQKGQSINVQRKMASWRRGVSLEKWPQAESQDPAFLDWLAGRSDSPPPFSKFEVDEIDFEYQTTTPSSGQQLSLEYLAGRDRRHRRTSSSSRGARRSCPLSSSGRKYGYAVHWNWQTCLNLHVWAPEVYQTVTFPVTVMRLFKVEEWDDNRKGKAHFDFEVEIYLRSMGHSTNSLMSRARPADERFLKDAGKPLPQPDRFAFCVACSKSDFGKLPDFPTVDLQEVAKNQIKAERKHDGDAPKHVWTGPRRDISYGLSVEPRLRPPIPPPTYHIATPRPHISRYDDIYDNDDDDDEWSSYRDSHGKYSSYNSSDPRRRPPPPIHVTMDRTQRPTDRRPPHFAGGLRPREIRRPSSYHEEIHLRPTEIRRPTSAQEYSPSVAASDSAYDRASRYSDDESLYSFRKSDRRRREESDIDDESFVMDTRSPRCTESRYREEPVRVREDRRREIEIEREEPRVRYRT